ncbi:hypothetical protein EHP00_908 [Ecytonucleospora hepatopenaei]|uniref:Uncharacterized protein n=1 Tax=Ecytonucleospora hepatopenaei TaxID=646526 RepID=A0A1W0E4T9_9MICR|nr:hypothetical protein EHP00_908 [Ecytonucleospora hepatopenaei]
MSSEFSKNKSKLENSDATEENMIKYKTNLTYSTLDGKPPQNKFYNYHSLLQKVEHQKQIIQTLNKKLLEVQEKHTILLNKIKNSEEIKNKVKNTEECQNLNQSFLIDQELTDVLDDKLNNNDH